MKTAKLEMKMVLAMLLLGYDYQVVDGQGSSPKSVPRVNRNDHHQVRPARRPLAGCNMLTMRDIRYSQPRPIAEDKVYIKFKRTVD